MIRCAVRLCERDAVIRGLCALHYNRQRLGIDLERPLRAAHGAKAKGSVAPEYTAWQRMRGRCSNPNSKDYFYYGQRGIGVCPEWDTVFGGFEAFLEHIGPRPSDLHTVDRIDTDGNYQPGNVRWATRAEQSRNRRPFTVDGTRNPRARVIEVEGVRRTIAGWARALGVDRGVVRGRLKRGWEPARAVTEPPGTTKSGPKKRAR